MRSTTSRLGAAGMGVALATTALYLPLAAGPAAAVVVPTPVSITLTDTDGDLYAGIYRRAAGEPAATLVAESPLTDLSMLTVSADGSRFAYVENTYSDDFETVRTRVVVRDVSGKVAGVVADTSDANTLLALPALSPDGSVAVWSQLVFGGQFVTSLRTAPVGSGTPTTITGSTDLFGSTFLDATTLLAGAETGVVTIPAAGGATTAGVNAPADAWEFVAAPNGTAIAWTKDTTPEEADFGTAEISTSSLSLTGGTATFGTPSVVATGLANYSPSWSRDSSALSFIKYDGDIGPGDVWSTPADGSVAATRTLATAADELEVEIGSASSLLPSATTAAFTLAGTAATIRWTLPVDAATVTGVLVTRSAPGAQTTSRTVAAPATSYTDTGLVLGKTYTYTFTTTDADGNRGTAVSRQMTAVKAAAVFADPTSTSATRAPFRVTLSPARSYTVNYRTNGGGYRNWLTARSGGVRIFGAASTGAAATSSRPGYSYAFQVQAFDAYGNATVPTSVGTAVVPYDQNAAAFSSGTVSAVADRWLGSARTLAAAGSFARLTVTGNRFQVIGERCPTCGIFDVYDNGRRIASVDSRATSRRARQVLYTRVLAAGSHTFVVKARGTAGRPNVVLDGFAVRR